MMPQYARYKAAISSAEVTAAENLRTLLRTSRCRASHKERAPATEATPKAVPVNNAGQPHERFEVRVGNEGR
jgi:hypothetical protein